MSKLLIKNDVVVDIVETSFPIHSSMHWEEGEAVVGDGFINGIVIPQSQEVEHVRTYIDERKKEYKQAFSDMDQIDIIQKQLQNMISLGEITALPETQLWLDTIEQIKLDNPEPAEVADENAVENANENAAV